MSNSTKYQDRWMTDRLAGIARDKSLKGFAARYDIQELKDLAKKVRSDKAVQLSKPWYLVKMKLNDSILRIEFYYHEHDERPTVHNVELKEFESWLDQTV